VVSTQRARAKTREKWTAFCAALGFEPLLKAMEPEHRLLTIEVFGYQYRTGQASKSGQPVRAGTVEAALCDVGTLFSELDRPDPRLEPGGTRYVASLKRWLIAIHKQDPAPSRVVPCSLSIIHALYSLSLNPRDTVARRLATTGTFFMNRPGEVVATSNKDAGRSAPFLLQHVTFYRPEPEGRQVTPTLQSPSNDVTGNAAVSLTYADQKNCIKGEKVSHIASGHPHVCPVRSLEGQVQYLLEHKAPPKTPLCTYYNKHNKPCKVTTTVVTKLLRKAAALVQLTTGIDPQSITSRSLRSGGATALLCAGAHPHLIALIGRWRSESILTYLRAQTTPSAKRFSVLMLEHGNFTFHPNRDAASTDYPLLPIELPQMYRDHFDPTDDASDDEYEPPTSTPTGSPTRRRRSTGNSGPRRKSPRSTP
jgi:hypothetical protein